MKLRERNAVNETQRLPRKPRAIDLSLAGSTSQKKFDPRFVGAASHKNSTRGSPDLSAVKIRSEVFGIYQP